MHSAHAPLPAKRLGGFYFAYYAAIGVLVPYLGLYLQARGFSPAEIGLSFGLLALTRVIAPYGWGAIADRHGRMPVVLFTLGGALACMAALPSFAGPAALLAVIGLYGMLVNGTMAQLEVVTFTHLGVQHGRYTRIRLWGSIGFLLLVVGLGPVLDVTGLLSLPYWIAGFFVVAWLVAWRIPEPRIAAPETQAAEDSAFAVALRPSVLALLIACLLAQLSFGPYYGFYSLYLADHGYSKSVTGLLWALGVLAEVGVFWWIPRYLPSLSLTRLFVISQAVTALRWALTPVVVAWVPGMAMVQLLHAVSFGVYHLAAVNLIQRNFPARLQGRGQAIYIGMSYGIGGAFGGWASGQLWGRLNNDHIWMLAALVAAAAALLAHWRVHDPR